MEVTGPLAESKRNKNPGPGTYELKHSLSSTVGFSLRGKNFKEIEDKMKVPGPGACKNYIIQTLFLSQSTRKGNTSCPSSRTAALAVSTVLLREANCQ